MPDFEFDPERHVAVTKDQLAVLQRGMGVLNKLWQDPKDGLAFKRKVKQVEPTWAIPEVDIVDQAAGPLREEITGLRKTVEDLVGTITTERQTAAEKADEADMTARLDQARKDYRLTDEGMEKVVAYMKEHRVADPLAAAARITDLMPKTAPTGGSSSYGPQALNLFGSKTEDANWADLHKDPEGWFDREVANVMREFENAA